MKPYQQRVVAEMQELSVKIDALVAFFTTELFMQLDVAEAGRLQRQAEHMISYRDVLKERIAAFE